MDMGAVAPHSQTLCQVCLGGGEVPLLQCQFRLMIVPLRPYVHAAHIPAIADEQQQARNSEDNEHSPPEPELPRTVEHDPILAGTGLGNAACHEISVD